jgi:peptidyl-prolyl cis-trans isomerase D
MDRLIQEKTKVLLAEKLGVIPGNKEVKAEIKKFPAFQNNGAFDITRYKILLSRNGLTPSKFEASMIEQVKVTTGQTILAELPVSKNYLKSVEGFRSKEFRAQLVSLNKNSLTKHLPVSKKEITDYLKEEANSKRVESTFKSRKSTFDKPEEVRARHILFKSDGKDAKKDAAVKKKLTELAKKVTASNFAAMATKHSEGPSKTKGGDLNWFSKGRMVKEFEAVAFSQKKGFVSAPIKTQFGYHLIYVEDKRSPVSAKLKDHSNDIAKEFIQKDKKTEISDFVNKLAAEVKSNFKSNNLKAVQAMQSKYGLLYEKDITVNQLDGATGKTPIKAEFIGEIFSKDLNSTNQYTFNEGDQVIVLQTSKMVEDPKEKQTAKDKEMETDGLKTTWARKASESMTKTLQDVVKVKVFNNRIRNL